MGTVGWKKFKVVTLAGWIAIALTAATMVFNEWGTARGRSATGELSAGPILLVRMIDVVFLVTAALLVWRRPKIRLRHLAFICVPILVCVLLAEGVLQVVFRTVAAKRRSRDFAAYAGWVTKENFESKEYFPNYGDVQYRTLRDGFRMYGDEKTTRTKVLVLGDSFTEANCISAGGTYYEEIQRRCPELEIFAYGCQGYGSLQEFMILDRYVDRIRPDVVLWQFCSNDLINNDHGLESVSSRHNNHALRPYLQEGEIVYLFPSLQTGWFYEASRGSALVRLVTVQLNIFKTDLGHSIEEKLHPSHPDLLRSVATTREILSRVRTRMKDKPVIAFPVDVAAFAPEAYGDICRTVDIDFVSSIPEVLESARKSGVRVDAAPSNPHWTTEGHALAGKVLAEYLTSRLRDGQGSKEAEGRAPEPN